MILVSYNIFEGARSRGSDRTDSVLNVILSCNPDIVGLCECTDFWNDDAARLRKFESALGMRAVMNHSQSGHDVALLYRPSLRILSEHESSVMMYHGYARLVISHPSLGRMAVIMAHLHPTSQLFRQGEAENLVSKATFETNAIVMGDFNTIAPDEAPVEELTPNARARLLLPDGTPNSAPVRAFLDRGFVDLGAKRKSPTYPTALGGKSHRLGTRLRIDYMFASAAVAKRADCSTVATALAEEASDHLPLKCELGD